MKQNTLIKMMAVGAVSALALSSSFAQTSTTHETTTTAGTTGVNASTTTSTSTLDGTGTITTFNPGESFSVRSESSTAPSTYYMSKDVTVVDPTGATVDTKYLRSDIPVKYTYVKQGDRMVVSKIIVQKPVAEITRETTTTTTTSHK
jgi:hypothetical protein